MAMAQTARTATGRRPTTHDFHTPAISLKQVRSKSANPAQLRPLSGIHGAAVSSRPRYVPPFSIQSQQKNTVVIDGPIYESAPKTASARARVPNPKILRRQQKSMSTFNLGLGLNGPAAGGANDPGRGTLFRMYFDRGDLPIKMEYLCGGDKIGWTVDIEKLDYSLYLPLFFDGLAETKHPYKTYARQGVTDLLLAGGEKIHPVIPQLILPLKSEYQGLGWHANASNFFGLIGTLRIRIQIRIRPRFRRIEHTKPGGNVHDIEDNPTAGHVLGFGGTRPGAFLQAVVAHVQCL
ncbi:uncharacterized protein [Drosophila takahashii]|uniref:uncharacterized protein isoform X2 n=1 Tax=Drosophila takahashii TaxID=29030 RepID=UPI0038991667